MITFLVAGDFGGPEVGVGFRGSRVLAAFVPVPEAPVDENGCLVLREQGGDAGGDGCRVEADCGAAHEEAGRGGVAEEQAYSGVRGAVVCGGVIVLSRKA